MMLLIAKATLAILMALGIGAAARRARASLRHAVYTALFVFLLLLPFAPRLMPEVAVRVPEQSLPSSGASRHLLPEGEGLAPSGPLPLGEGGRRPGEGANR